MKRAIIITCFIFSAVSLFAQLPEVQRSKSNVTAVDDNLYVRLLFELPHDTLGTTVGHLASISGVLYIRGLNYWERLAKYSEINISYSQNRLISGGKVVWLHDYVYNVSAANYVIDDQPYNSPSTDITLSAADATDDRIDLFVLTTSGTAVAITGTPSTPAAAPDYDANTKLQISFATVTAASTEPTISTEFIYKENTEWTTNASAVTINPNSTNNPYAGSKDVEGTNVLTNQYISFTSGSTINMGLYDNLIFQIRSKANWSTTKKWIIRFYNGTTAIGNSVNFGNSSYGFVSSSLAQYQTITIPLSDFGNVSTATAIRITQSNSSGSVGWYLDNMQLQSGQEGGTPSTISLAGDATGSGTNTISTTVTGLRNKVLPALSAGNLRYNGSAWVFDNTTYQAQINGTGFVKATGTTISYDNSTYTPTSRTITTGYGLTGGGDLSTDRTFKVDTTLITTRAWRDKLADSLAALIVAGGGSLFPTSGTGIATGNVTGDLDGNNLSVANAGHVTIDADDSVLVAAATKVSLVSLDSLNLRAGVLYGIGTRTTLVGTSYALVGLSDSSAAFRFQNGLIYAKGTTTGTGSIARIDATTKAMSYSSTINVSSEVTGVGNVVNGMTGVSSFTAYAPIFGGTTSTGALQSGTVGTAGQVLTSNGAGALPTFQAAPAASTVPISGLLAATTTNTINSKNYAQVWGWDSLAAATGLKISSTSTVATSNTQTLFAVDLSGTNATSAQTTYAATISNSHAGTGSSNVALSLSATNGVTGNYALLVTNGNVGIGTTTPTELLHIKKDQNAATNILIDNQTNNTAAASQIKLLSASEATGFLIAALPSSNSTSGSPMSVISSGTNNLSLRAPSGKNINLTVSSGGTLTATTGLNFTGVTSANPTMTINDGGTGASANTLLRLQTTITTSGAAKAIKWHDGANNIGAIDVRYNANSQSTMVFGSLVDGTTYSSTDLAAIWGNGNFIVGSTTDNGYKTDIQGTLYAKGSVSVDVLSTPVISNVITAGSAGSTSYTYKVVAKTGNGTTTAASAGGTVATGNATLNSSNYNIITFNRVVGAFSYDIYRTASAGTPATLGKIATVTANNNRSSQVYNDQGAAGDGATEPSVNTTGSLSVGTTTATSMLTLNGSFARKYNTTAVDVTLDGTYDVVEVTVTGKTVTLPTAVGITGRVYTIKLTASGSGTVATTSSQNIDASTTYSLASQYKYVTVQSNGTNWIVISNNGVGWIPVLIVLLPTLVRRRKNFFTEYKQAA